MIVELDLSYPIKCLWNDCPQQDGIRIPEMIDGHQCRSRLGEVLYADDSDIHEQELEELKKPAHELTKDSPRPRQARQLYQVWPPDIGDWFRRGRWLIQHTHHGILRVKARRSYA